MQDVQTPQLEETVAPVTLALPPPPPEDIAAVTPLPEAVPPPPPPPPPPSAIQIQPAWLRLAFAFEFLLALLVGLEMWTQVGGQGHMDLLPWYIKLSCTTLVAWCTVKLTAAMMEQPNAWSRRSKFWLTGILLTAAVMGGITYYYHLHEVTDEPDTDENATTSVRNITPGRLSSTS